MLLKNVNNDTVEVEKKLFCILAEITERTLYNWVKQGRVEISGNNVLVKRNKIFIFNEEVANVKTGLESQIKTLFQRRVKKTIKEVEEIKKTLQDLENILRV